MKNYMIGCFCFLLIAGCGIKRSIVLTKNDIRSVAREVTFSGNTLHLNAAEGGGMAILKNTSFSKGTIHFDIKGENNPGQSFVGLAFNIENDTTYEAVYFRPFNFASTEIIRREHSIQYVYEPNYSWSRLRKENTGEFEAEFFDPPSPDDWFSVSVTIEINSVSVKDARSGKILMQTKRLSNATSDKIGFWVGHNSIGSFKNLRIE